VSGFVSNIEVVWEYPTFAPSRRRLASFARAVYFDKRGTGLSDRDAGVPSLDERVDDMLAVLDAAQSERAAVVGASEGGPMSLLFAATHPQRVTALVLWDSFATLLRSKEQPWGIDPERFAWFLEFVSNDWGTGEVLRAMAPSAANDPNVAEWCGRYERLGASPGAALSLARLAGSIDVRWVLDVISVPTLVLHRTGNPVVPVEHGRALAAGIRDVQFVELPGSDHIALNYEDDALDRIEEFLSGTLTSRPADRVLATVLFADVVGSTDTLARLGDDRWRTVLDTHDAAYERTISQHRGRVVRGTGDGLLATFDSPGIAISAGQGRHRVAAAGGLELRIGIHTGEIETRGPDIAGMTVHIAARTMSHASGGETLVTRTVTELLAGSRHRFDYRGDHRLKGVPGSWTLFLAEGITT
jgi:class 3 adenylate cyclase